MCVDLGHAHQSFKLRLGLRHEGNISEVDDEAVAEDRLVNALHQVLIVLAHEVVHCIDAGDKLCGGDIVQRFDAALNGLGLFLVCDSLIDKYNYLILVLKVLDKSVDIHRQQGYDAHDDKAGHDDSHGGEGHKAVGGDAAEAFADKIAPSAYHA